MTFRMTGFHGTKKSNISNILSSGFTATARNDHWLGQGIYFYTDEALAKWWIETKNKSVWDCAVIEVEIEAPKADVLNLDTVVGVDFFLQEIKEILQQLSDKGVSIEFDIMQNEYRNLCYALDLIKVEHQTKVVICTFIKSNPTYGKESISDFEKRYFPLPLSLSYKETQICITDNSVIVKKRCCYQSSNRAKWN